MIYVIISEVNTPHNRCNLFHIANEKEGVISHLVELVQIRYKRVPQRHFVLTDWADTVMTATLDMYETCEMEQDEDSIYACGDGELQEQLRERVYYRRVPQDFPNV